MEVEIGPADGALMEAFYADVYLPAFAHQREPLEAWRAAVAGRVPYAWTLVIAGDALDDPARRRIDGGVVFERYPRSACGFVTYLVVAAHARRGGLGARLLARARAGLAGAPLVVAEIHDPAHAPDAGAARARLAWFAARGARVLDVRYVQPDLGYGRDRHLVLVAFVDASADRAPPDDVDGAPLRAFVRELYEVVEGPRAAGAAIDDELAAVLASIGPRVRLLAPRG